MSRWGHNALRRMRYSDSLRRIQEARRQAGIAAQKANESGKQEGRKPAPPALSLSPTPTLPPAHTP
jgi:hypothetical protein